MRYFFLAFLFFYFAPVHAQKRGLEYIDSMLAMLPSAKDDTNKTKLLYRIGDAYNSIDPQLSMRYALIGLEHARKLNFKKGIASFYLSIGNLLSDQGYYDSAIAYFKQTYEIDKKIDYPKGYVSALVNMAAAEQRRSNYVKAADYIMQALPAAEKMNDVYLLTVIYNNISDVYFDQSDFVKAAAFNQKALDLARKNNNPENIGSALHRMGNFALQSGDTAKAINIYQQAVNIYLTTDDKAGLATEYSMLGNAEGKDPRKQLDYYLRAQQLWDTLSPDFPIAITNLANIGKTYLDIYRYDSLHLIKPGGLIPPQREQLLRLAKKYLEKAITQSSGSGDASNYSYCSGVLAELFRLEGDYKNAYINLQRSVDGRDSLFSQESKNKIANIMSEREIALRDKQIELNNISIAAQKKQRLALVTGILLLLTIGGLLYWQNQTRKKTNTTLVTLNNELGEANKIKNRFFGIISHDLRSPIANLVNFLHLQKEAPDLLTREQAAKYQSTISNSAESLLDTMEAMLLWSKSQMEHFKPHEKKIAVGSIFDYLRAQFPNTPTTSIGFFNPGNLTLNTDEDYLKTIVHNLTANAIRALQNTKAGKIAWKAYEEDGKVILSISDNGPGASEEQLDALYNNEAVVSTKNGLGLHLIRDLAKAIHCAVSFSTQPGAGITFKLQMP